MGAHAASPGWQSREGYRFLPLESGSNASTGFKLLAVKGERHRRNLIAKGARPVLPSSAWKRVYEEVGLS